MNALTLEWLKKAEDDFIVATELLKLRLESGADAICFHCQQCAEKYLKTFLHHQGIEFPRTHDLLELLVLCRTSEDTFATLLLQLQALNSYSVETRYPGRFTSLEEAQGAVEAVEIVRNFVRSKLGL
jgi:HEPN domain-containing protein